MKLFRQRNGHQESIANSSSPIYGRPCFGCQADKEACFVVGSEIYAIVGKALATYLSGYCILKIKDVQEAKESTPPTEKRKWSKRAVEIKRNTVA